MKPPIHTLLVGKAYGLSALLLASGDKGHRSTLPCGVAESAERRGSREEPRGAERSREGPRGAERGREEPRGAEIGKRAPLDAALRTG